MEESLNAICEQEQYLWKQFQRLRSVENKNQLVLHYLFLVRSIASRLMPLYSAHTNYDDLIGYGVLGLIDAVEKFMPERGIRFDSYASKRIKGEIIDNMRKQDWASASLRSRIKQIGRAYDTLGCEQDEVGEEKVAGLLGLDVQQVRAALEKAYMFNMVHFEAILNNGDGSSASVENLLPESEEEGPQRQLERLEFKKTLLHAIERLSPNERQVITLYYYEELMLKDIARLMEVTPARVSQIHSRALLKIRMEIEKYLQESD
ncbi:MAG: FliA/WhiG family RNA polymerase sigma factor [Candidatus Pelethousia sp.]|nr:FliA/WhiG family RNA polymerase sigma factor [Candidatus Pelethousia sp.]